MDLADENDGTKLVIHEIVKRIYEFHGKERVKDLSSSWGSTYISNGVLGVFLGLGRRGD